MLTVVNVLVGVNLAVNAVRACAICVLHRLPASQLGDASSVIIVAPDESAMTRWKSLSVSSLNSVSVALIRHSWVSGLFGMRVVDGMVAGIGNARRFAIVVSCGVRLTRFAVVSVPVLTASRSTPQVVALMVINSSTSPSSSSSTVFLGELHPSVERNRPMTVTGMNVRAAGDSNFTMTSACSRGLRGATRAR